MLKKICLLSVLLFLFFEGVHCQANWKLRLESARNHSQNRLEQIDSIKAVLVHLDKSDYHDTIAFANYFISYRHYSLYNHRLTIQYAEASMRNFQKSEYAGIRKGRVINYLVDAHTLLNEPNTAVAKFHKYYNKQYFTSNPNDESSLIRAVAECYRIIGDVHSGLILIEEFLRRTDQTKLSASRISNILLEKSLALSNMKEYERAQTTIDQAIRKIEELPKSNFKDMSIANLLNQKSILEIKLGNYTKAFSIINNTLSKYGQDTLSKTLLTTNAAFTLGESGSHLKALEYGKLSEFYSAKIDDATTRSLALNNLSLCYMNLDSFAQALAYIDKSFHQLVLKDIDEIADWNDLPNKKLLCNALDTKIKILQEEFLHNGNREKLRKAKTMTYKMDQLADLIRAEMNVKEANININNILSKYYQRAIDISFLTRSIEDFLYFSEKNRSLSNIKFTRFGASEKIKAIRSSIIKAEYQNFISPSDSLNDLISKLKLEYLQNNDLREQKRDVLNLKMNLNNKDILYYQSGIDSLYALKISQIDSTFLCLGLKDSISNLVSNYILNIKDGRNSILDRKIGKQLYQTLIKPLKPQQTYLLIFTNGVLSKLPFDALIDSDNEFLINEKVISYGTSLNLFNHNNSSAQTSISKLDIISPQYQNDMITDKAYAQVRGGNTYNFKNLQFGDVEVESIREQLNLHVNIDKDLIKAEVLHKFSTSDIIHFTGHSVINEKNSNLSYMALNSESSSANDVITTQDISLLYTNLDMVMLNSCSSGTGNFIEGEGTFSLARSFLESGAKSVLSAYWKIDDKSSSEISIAYYKHLGLSENKASALRMAKLDYIDNVNSDWQLHPYFWAGLNLIGDPRPLKFRTWNYKFILISFLIIAIVISFLILRSIRQ